MINYLLERISIEGRRPPGIEVINYSAFSVIINEDCILLYDDDGNLQESIIIDHFDCIFQFINKDENIILYQN